MPCLRGAALARHRACDVLRLATCRALRGAALTTCCVLQRVACCDVPSICYATPCDVRRPAMCDALRGAALATCCALQRVARCDVPDICYATPCDVRALRGHALRYAALTTCCACNVPRAAMCRTLGRVVLRCAAHCDAPRIATCCAPAHATPSPARWHRSERRDRDLEFPRMYLANSQISPIQMKWEE